MTEKSALSKTLKLIAAHLTVWWECSFPGHGRGGAFRLPLTHIDRNRRRDLISSLIISLLAMLVIIGIICFPTKKTEPPPRTTLQTNIIPAPILPPKKKPPPPQPPKIVTPPLPYVPPPKVVVPELKNALKEKVTHIKPVKQEKPKPKKKIKKVRKHKAPAKSQQNASQAEGDDDDDAADSDAEANHSAGATPINGARPEYPPAAEDDNREGKVVASCDILPSGHTANCKIVSHKGGNDFVSSAMDFLARARYEPSMENGKPVTEHNHMLTIDFTLGD